MSNVTPTSISDPTIPARPHRNIGDLAQLVSELSDEQRARVDRRFQIVTSTGLLEAPRSMHSWIEGLFGSVAAVEAQRIIRTTNLRTFEGTLFNELRASRP